MIEIREIQIGDAKIFLELNKRLDKETNFMMFEPGERSLLIEDQKKRIRIFIENGNQNLFIAQMGEELVGYIAAMGGSYQRNFHKAHIVIGLLQEYVGQGLGMRLFKSMENWARRIDLHRLELTVMVHNERAIALYKKMGFTIEGKIKHSLYIYREYIDEFLMAKIIDNKITEQMD